MKHSLKKLSLGAVFGVMALALAVPGYAFAQTGEKTQQLLCFSGSTDEGDYNGTCTVTHNGATLNTVDGDEDPNNGYAGVYYAQAGLGGRLLNEADALAFSYDGSGATGGSPRLSIPIDENNDGSTEMYAYVDTLGCNDGDANKGTLDVVNDQTCTVNYNGVTYEN